MRSHSYGRFQLAGLMLLALLVMTTGAQEIFDPARLASPQTGHRPDLEAMPSQAPYMPGRPLVKYSSPAANSIAAQRFERDPMVEVATPDYQAFPAAVPNDPNYSLQWGHDNTPQMLDYCWSCGGHPSGSPVGTVGVFQSF